MPRGGARPGGGRPKGDRKKVWFYVNQQEREILYAYLKKIQSEAAEKKTSDVQPV